MLPLLAGQERPCKRLVYLFVSAVYSVLYLASTYLRLHKEERVGFAVYTYSREPAPGLVVFKRMEIG